MIGIFSADVTSSAAVKARISNTSYLEKVYGKKEKKKSLGELLTSISEKSLLKRVTTGVPLIAFSVASTWLFAGIVFYAFNSNMTFYNSYFYSISAGMNIGFANLNEISVDRVHAFTAFFILIGSATTHGVVGYCLGHYLASHNNLVDPEINTFENSLRFLNTTSSARQKDSNYFHRSWYHLKQQIGWYAQRTVIKSAILFVVWMLMGVAYGMGYEGWSFITSLYFAITSSSSAGLQSPPCKDPSTFESAKCDLGVTRAALAGVFCMIGVPGKFACKESFPLPEYLVVFFLPD